MPRSEILKKLNFFFKRPKVVIITGNGRKCAKEAIFQVLKEHFRVGKEVFIYETDLTNLAETEKFKFFLRKSRLPILVVTHVGEYHPEKEFFAGDLKEVSPIKELIKVLPSYGYLILNFDDETVRDLKNESNLHYLTFGFGARASVRATDVILTQTPSPGTNFKINYEGNIVPVWLKNLFGKEQIYTALVAAAVGEVLGLNLVEVSSALKTYHSLPGRMQLIEGIKNSWILDDSENASPLSMLEAISILGKIETRGRKIAVLGDIVGIGKYTIEAHEALGEKVGQSADLLFTVGPRAEFIAQGAVKNGMAEEKIFKFDDTKSAGLALQEKMREGDLILVDGSKEMSMIDIVKEVRAHSSSG